MKLGEVFDPRNNALNAWRLTLATGVILWHSWPLTGHKAPSVWVEQLGSQVAVDAFFAVSGFLITSSWVRRPVVREYASARGLRILPGLWVCVLVTAFVFAPVSVLIQHGSMSALWASGAPVAYALNNCLMNVVFYVGIDGTPKDVPWPGVWNGSLWTLVFEMGCYIVVALIGVAGLLKYRWTIPIAFGLTLAATAVFGFPSFGMSTIPQMVARFAVMFAAGALLSAGILSGQYAATAAFKTANDWGSVKPWFINFVAVIRHDVPDLNSLQVWIPNSLAAGGLATSMSCCAKAA